ncbi:MAG: vitamin B12-dependent ribonucleotide reductase [Thermodesulfovibrionales bacterium]|jgi:ribonucleoside-diphosphate reductase alpha chain
MLTTLPLTDNAQKVLEKRYLLRNKEGQVIETPEDLFRRVASFVASADTRYGKFPEQVKDTEEKFYDMMTSLAFLPNSPTLMNAGRDLGQLSACFVLPVGDSMEEIFDSVKHAAIIHKSGGGTGFSFSRLRPNGDVVGSTKGVSSGPISFMTVFDTATEAVKQGGTRRGANMGLLRVDHPDIMSFITCKDHNSKLTNFNISVGITDIFMEMLEADREYSLFNPRSGEIVGSLKAKEVFEKIVSQAWKNGEPGIVFLDKINDANPTVGEIESTNPCGEQPLLPYESCNLGSINLSRMVREDGEVDWTRLREVTWRAVHFLDNVIDMNKYPLEMIAEMTRANRKIGLGVMGWADMLIQMGTPYNSERAIGLAKDVMGVIQEEGKKASSELAKERGSFPNFERSIYAGGPPMRNATVTTIAPTGTLSIIAGCSSGIEPLFAVSFVRNVMEGTKLIEVHPEFSLQMGIKCAWWHGAEEDIARAGSIQGFESIPEEIRMVFVTAHDINPTDHIRMQAAFQKHTDNAVSKTVNFPHSATTQDVENVYLMAYKTSCKGVTVYRDGSREEQVLSTGKGEARGAKDEKKQIAPKPRPTNLPGLVRLIKTGCGDLFVTITQDEDEKPFEVFTTIGKAGGCAASQAEAIGRLLSIALRSGIEPKELVKQLKGISCHQPTWGEGGKIVSCADAIAKALEGFVDVKTWLSDQAPIPTNGEMHVEDEALFFGACPECGGAVEHEGGCKICRDCGFTTCG